LWYGQLNLICRYDFVCFFHRLQGEQLLHLK
jgi:hypothetical protein